MHHHIGDCIGVIFKKIKNNQECDLTIKLISNWHKIVGADIYQIAWPQKIIKSHYGNKDYILYLRAKNSSNAFQLTYTKELIIDQIAIYLGYKLITKIIINV